MSARPAWEETWEHCSDGVVCAKQGDWSDDVDGSRFDWEQGTNFGRFGANSFVTLSRDDERASLAAAAPDLARALLTVEWSGHDDYKKCPECAMGPGDGHAIDCKLDRALKKAGVR